MRTSILNSCYEEIDIHVYTDSPAPNIQVPCVCCVLKLSTYVVLKKYAIRKCDMAIVRCREEDLDPYCMSVDLGPLATGKRYVLFHIPKSCHHFFMSCDFL